MKFLVKFVTTIALATLSVNASAILIAEVGTLDTKIAQTTLSSSGAGTEEAWIESVLGVDVTYNQLSGSGGSSWQQVTDGNTGDYAFDFGAGNSPSHFLVKIGGGSGANADNTHFLYSNLASLRWAFLNLADFGAGVTLTNIGIISHVGTTDPVPAPGPLALLAIGMIGIGLRKMKKSS